MPLFFGNVTRSISVKHPLNNCTEIHFKEHGYEGVHLHCGEKTVARVSLHSGLKHCLSIGENSYSPDEAKRQIAKLKWLLATNKKYNQVNKFWLYYCNRFGHKLDTADRCTRCNSNFGEKYE